jgi:glycine/D-amino acid oxidase-like deaminating enzyme
MMSLREGLSLPQLSLKVLLKLKIMDINNYIAVQKYGHSVYEDPCIQLAPIRQHKAHCAADVVVIGAGLTGLSAAWHCRQNGQSVIVLEAQTIGFGASGRNGGQVNAGLKATKIESQRQFGMQSGSRFYQLAANAPARLINFIHTNQIDCELTVTGTLKVTRLKDKTFKQMQLDRYENDVVHTCDDINSPGPRYLGHRELAEWVGSEYYQQGWFDPNGASLQPKQLLCEWAKQARSAGIEIYEHSPALRVIHTPSGYTFETPHGSVQAHKVVLATDGYSDHLWPRLETSIVPIYSCIMATEPLDKEQLRRILPKRPCVYETQRVTAYYRIDAAGRLLMGGRGPQRALQDSKDIAPLIRHMHHIWPALKSTTITHAWNGQFALTPDYYPRLHRPARHVWAGLGYSGRGVAMAFAMGQQIAQSIAGCEDEDLDVPVTPIAPINGHRYWRLGVQWNMGLYRLLDQWDRVKERFDQ